jgi:DNA-binding PadR family transcriptional regulator
MVEGPRETPEQQVARRFDISLGLARNGKWGEALKAFRLAEGSGLSNENLRDEYKEAILEECSLQLQPKEVTSPGDSGKRKEKIRAADRLPAEAEMVILRFLETGEERYGLEFVAANPEKLRRNSIYVILTRMVARGYLLSRIEAEKEKKKAGPSKRLYKITAFGLQQYHARLASDRAAERVQDTLGVRNRGGMT